MISKQVAEGGIRYIPEKTSDEEISFTQRAILDHLFFKYDPEKSENIPLRRKLEIALKETFVVSKIIKMLRNVAIYGRSDSIRIDLPPAKNEKDLLERILKYIPIDSLETENPKLELLGETKSFNHFPELKKNMDENINKPIKISLNEFMHYLSTHHRVMEIDLAIPVIAEKEIDILVFGITEKGTPKGLVFFAQVGAKKAAQQIEIVAKPIVEPGLSPA